MSGNRELPGITRDSRVSALQALAKWIEREGESARGIRIVRLIAENDLNCLHKGVEPAPMDPATICEVLRQEGDRLPEGDPGEVVRNSKPEAALQKRLARLAMAWDAKDMPWLPSLTRSVGGGRGLTSTYQLEFVRSDMADDQRLPPSDVADSLSYQIRPAKASWWIGWLFIPEGFAVSLRSWRGMILLVLLFLAGLSLIGAFGLAWLALGHPGPVRTLDLWLFVACAILGLGVWPTLRTFGQAVDRRLVSAPDGLLAFSEAFGQLRFLRRRDTKSPEGWISLVRITSECPSCGAAIELLPGAPDFPGRMVGRCRDAPSEHVFSFDPTTFRGIRLVAWRNE
jgi:hypothetical protein